MDREIFNASPVSLVSDEPMQPAPPVLTRAHTRRLRNIYRSAGWPCLDLIEIELMAAGMVQRICSAQGHATLQVTDSGIALLAQTLQSNRNALSRHEALVEQVAREMTRAGRITWRGLGLRAQLPPLAEGGPRRWCMARPDVFSIRNTSVEAYLEPIVHEIKVSRADLLGDLKRLDKRTAYLDLGGECWYVLGRDARGRAIGDASEIPQTCGVMVVLGDSGGGSGSGDAGGCNAEGQAIRLSVVRAAPRQVRAQLPFAVWLSLAKATPVKGLNDEDQQWLAAGEDA